MPTLVVPQLSTRNTRRLLLFLVILFALASAGADPRSARVGQYKYTSTRCDRVYGPFLTEAAAAREAAFGEYSKGCEPPVYRPDQPWGALTSICTWVTGAAYRDGIEYWSPRRYVVNFFAPYFDWPSQQWICSDSYNDSLAVMRERVVCAHNEIYFDERIGCVRLSEYDKISPRRCEGRLVVGNPVEPATGSKEQVFDLGIGYPGLPLVIQYNSRYRPTHEVFEGRYLPPPETGQVGVLGGLWFSSVHRALVRQLQQIVVGRGAFNYSRFNVRGPWDFTAGDGERNSLIPVQGGYGFVDRESGRIEVFDSDKRRLVEIVQHDGLRYTLSYTAGSDASAPGSGYLTRIVDSFGRELKFNYGVLDADDPSDAGFLQSAEDAGGAKIEFGFDGRRRLVSIKYPDAWSQILLYEDERHPWALTGIADAAGARTRWFGYDEYGNAVSTSKGDAVDKYAIGFDKPPGRVTIETLDEPNKILYRVHEWQQPTNLRVVTPAGVDSAIETERVNGFLYPVAASQAAGSGCAAASRQQGFDDQGNLLWASDFNGVKACRAYDLSRNLEVTRVDGLGVEAQCGPLLAGEAIPAGARKISTRWHPDWHLATRVAEPGRIVTRVYNGQPDPFNGNALARCAPISAKLPDDKPIVVLCKEVHQATTDATGALGFGAPLDASVPARVEQWTYNGFGQPLTHDGARTDLPDRTTFDYHDSTTADHTVGDLRQVTNPLGHVTQYPKYDKVGNLLQMIDPNGVVTDYSYDARRRLRTLTVAGATTRYEYHPMGLLAQITEPDDSFLRFGYDAAERLTDVEDSQGHRVHYELDGAGNRRAERFVDAEGQLRRRLERVFDVLNRLEVRTGRE